MRVISVNVGQPREVEWGGERVRTGIFKEPVAGPVMMRRLNLEGDRQADRRVHGGPTKAVYLYPAEHYPLWRAELPEMELPWGMFGENLTALGLSESEVFIGDRFRVGEAQVQVTEPRMPCYKLAGKFGRPEIIREFLESGRSGFYLAVTQEGLVGAGDAIEYLERDPHRVTVTDVVRLHTGERNDVDLLRRALAAPALSFGWKRRFRRQLERLTEGATG
jgi:MOSC domain-containing protein YiiM